MEIEGPLMVAITRMLPVWRENKELRVTLDRFRALVRLVDTENGDGWWLYPPAYAPDESGLESIHRVLARQLCEARAAITDEDMDEL